MKRILPLLPLLLLLVPALPAQTAFLMRVAPQITLADAEKVVVPLELVNTGTVPLQFGATTANQAWGLSGAVVLPGMAIGIPLRTFVVPAGASTQIPTGYLTNVGPNFGLYLPGGLFVHINANPPSNALAYLQTAMNFGPTVSAPMPTVALPASQLVTKSGNPGDLSWGTSYNPGWAYYNVVSSYTAARGACLVLCGNLQAQGTLATNVFGTIGRSYVLLLSARRARIPTIWGPCHLDLSAPLFIAAIGVIGSTGADRTWIPVPTALPPGLRLYMQAIVLDAALTQIEFTNLAEI